MDPTTPQQQNEVAEVLTSQQPVSTFTKPSNPSQYIRTYAKDVALLTNTPPPETPVASTPSETASSKFDIHSVADMMRRSHEEQERLARAPIQDVEEISDEYPDVPQEETQPTEQEQEIVTETISEEAPDRETILQRLRDRLHTPAPEALLETIPVPENLPAIPTNEILPVLVPEPTVEKRVPEIVSLPEAPASVEPLPLTSPYLQPSVSESTAQPEPVSEPSRLHTYSSDFAQRIDQQGSSAFSVLATNSDAKQQVGTKQKQRAPLVPIIVGCLMLIVGIGAVAGAFILIRKEPNLPTVSGVPSLITFDESVEVRGRGTELMKDIVSVAQKGSVSGNVIVTYITNATSTTTGVPQPGGLLIRDLNLDSPDILMRNIALESTVGTIRAGSESRPFFILRVNSYERTFAGMLAWESILPQELNLFYPSYASVDFQSTSTILSTQPTTFVDDVVANYNVRVLRDAYGKSLMLYGYKDKSTLIIARDEAAFSALVARLATSGK